MKKPTYTGVFYRDLQNYIFRQGVLQNISLFKARNNRECVNGYKLTY